MTRPEIIGIMAWQRAHKGRISYSQGGTRLLTDAKHMTSPTDCSGMVHRMFWHFAHIDVGTYTDNECEYGQLITTSRPAAAAGRGMIPGDVVLFKWRGENSRYRYDHIAIYAGNGYIWNHGGPVDGPLYWRLDTWVGRAERIMVRRYLQPTKPQPHDLLEIIVALDRSSKDYDQFGDDMQARAGHGVHDHVLDNENGDPAKFSQFVQTDHNRLIRVEKNLQTLMRHFGLHYDTSSRTKPAAKPKPKKK